jgi:hypothetical protein
MDWIKVYDRHYYGWTDSMIGGMIKIQLLAARLERTPTAAEIERVTHYKTLEAIQQKLNDESTDLQRVLNEVSTDVQRVVNKRAKDNLRNAQAKGKDAVIASDSPSSREVEKRREDKRRVYSKKKFVPPLKDEVLKYIKDGGLSVDGEYFYRMFSESNWVDTNGKPVVSWKGKLITWDKMERSRKPTTISAPVSPRMEARAREIAAERGING